MTTQGRIVIIRNCTNTIRRTFRNLLLFTKERSCKRCCMDSCANFSGLPRRDHSGVYGMANGLPQDYETCHACVYIVICVNVVLCTLETVDLNTWDAHAYGGCVLPRLVTSDSWCAFQVCIWVSSSIQYHGDLVHFE